MTYTILATDQHAQLIGVATASKSLAVGRSVPAVDPTYGAVASQAYTNATLRHHMLAALRAGHSPEEAIGQIPRLDAEHEYRQVSVIDAQGHGAAHTGALASQWAGHVLGQGYVLTGNYLTGPEVLKAMEERFTVALDPASQWERPEFSFARRLVATLSAGEHAGGDARGKQSAALMVASAAEPAHFPPELMIDLRVDHHPEPVSHLQMLTDLRTTEG